MQEIFFWADKSCAGVKVAEGDICFEKANGRAAARRPQHRNTGYELNLRPISIDGFRLFLVYGFIVYVDGFFEFIDL